MSFYWSHRCEKIIEQEFSEMIRFYWWQENINCKVHEGFFLQSKNQKSKNQKSVNPLIQHSKFSNSAF